MKIGFDAKRAFHNSTGLGNYSRTLIEGLARFYPQHQYYLFNPRPSGSYQPPFSNVHEIRPSGIHKNFSSLWRSSWMKKDLQKTGIDLYHGLSHEIPVGIEKTKIPSVVTIHDLIFEKYPEQFKKIDVHIYRKKFRNACIHSNRIIAISRKTKQDIVELYKIDAGKIDVCYQSCDPVFEKETGKEQIEKVRRQYQLPGRFFLYVGSIIERKNLMNICRAMKQVKDQINVPLVVIGEGKSYKQKLKQFIGENKLESNIVFLSGAQSPVKDDLAAIYQMAIALVYPSFYEGFGLPVLEALWSRTPVITSGVSCLPEAGGEAAYYVNPASSEEIAKAMLTLFSDEALRKNMIEKGWQHAQNFSLDKCAASVMNVYNKIV